MKRETVGYENIRGYVYDEEINPNRLYDIVIIKNLKCKINKFMARTVIFYNVNNTTIKCDKLLYSERKIYFINCNNIDVTVGGYNSVDIIIDNSTIHNLSNVTPYSTIKIINCKDIDLSDYSIFKYITIRDKCENIYVSKKCKICYLIIEINTHISNIKNIINGRELYICNNNYIDLYRCRMFNKIRIVNCYKVIASKQIHIKDLFIDNVKRINLNNVYIKLKNIDIVDKNNSDIIINDYKDITTYMMNNNRNKKYINFIYAIN